MTAPNTPGAPSPFHWKRNLDSIDNPDPESILARVTSPRGMLTSETNQRFHKIGKDMGKDLVSNVIQVESNGPLMSDQVKDGSSMSPSNNHRNPKLSFSPKNNNFDNYQYNLANDNGLQIKDAHEFEKLDLKRSTGNMSLVIKDMVEEQLSHYDDYMTQFVHNSIKEAMNTQLPVLKQSIREEVRGNLIENEGRIREFMDERTEGLGEEMRLKDERILKLEKWREGVVATISQLQQELSSFREDSTFHHSQHRGRFQELESKTKRVDTLILSLDSRVTERIDQFRDHIAVIDKDVRSSLADYEELLKSSEVMMHQKITENEERLRSDFTLFQQNILQTQRTWQSQLEKNKSEIDDFRQSVNRSLNVLQTVDFLTSFDEGLSGTVTEGANSTTNGEVQVKHNIFGFGFKPSNSGNGLNSRLSPVDEESNLMNTENAGSGGVSPENKKGRSNNNSMQSQNQNQSQAYESIQIDTPNGIKEQKIPMGLNTSLTESKSEIYSDNKPATAQSLASPRNNALQLRDCVDWLQKKLMTSVDNRIDNVVEHINRMHQTKLDVSDFMLRREDILEEMRKFVSKKLTLMEKKVSHIETGNMSSLKKIEKTINDKMSFNIQSEMTQFSSRLQGEIRKGLHEIGIEDLIEELFNDRFLNPEKSSIVTASSLQSEIEMLSNRMKSDFSTQLTRHEKLIEGICEKRSDIVSRELRIRVNDVQQKFNKDLEVQKGQFSEHKREFNKLLEERARQEAERKLAELSVGFLNSTVQTGPGVGHGQGNFGLPIDARLQDPLKGDNFGNHSSTNQGSNYQDSDNTNTTNTNTQQSKQTKTPLFYGDSLLTGRPRGEKLAYLNRMAGLSTAPYAGFQGGLPVSVVSTTQQNQAGNNNFQQVQGLGGNVTTTINTVPGVEMILQSQTLIDWIEQNETICSVQQMKQHVSELIDEKLEDVKGSIFHNAVAKIISTIQMETFANGSGLGGSNSAPLNIMSSSPRLMGPQSNSINSSQQQDRADRYVERKIKVAIESMKQDLSDTLYKRLTSDFKFRLDLTSEKLDKVVIGVDNRLEDMAELMESNLDRLVDHRSDSIMSTIVSKLGSYEIFEKVFSDERFSGPHEKNIQRLIDLHYKSQLASDVRRQVSTMVQRALYQHSGNLFGGSSTKENGFSDPKKIGEFFASQNMVYTNNQSQSQNNYQYNKVQDGKDIWEQFKREEFNNKSQQMQSYELGATTTQSQTTQSQSQNQQNYQRQQQYEMTITREQQINEITAGTMVSESERQIISRTGANTNGTSQKLKKEKKDRKSSTRNSNLDYSNYVDTKKPTVTQEPTVTESLSMDLVHQQNGRPDLNRGTSVLHETSMKSINIKSSSESESDLQQQQSEPQNLDNGVPTPIRPSTTRKSDSSSKKDKKKEKKSKSSKSKADLDSQSLSGKSRSISRSNSASSVSALGSAQAGSQSGSASGSSDEQFEATSSKNQKRTSSSAIQREDEHNYVAPSSDRSSNQILENQIVDVKKYEKPVIQKSQSQITEGTGSESESSVSESESGSSSSKGSDSKSNTLRDAQAVGGKNANLEQDSDSASGSGSSSASSSSSSSSSSSGKSSTKSGSKSSKSNSSSYQTPKLNYPESQDLDQQHYSTNFLSNSESKSRSLDSTEADKHYRKSLKQRLESKDLTESNKRERRSIRPLADDLIDLDTKWEDQFEKLKLDVNHNESAHLNNNHYDSDHSDVVISPTSHLSVSNTGTNITGTNLSLSNSFVTNTNSSECESILKYDRKSIKSQSQSRSPNKRISFSEKVERK